MPGWAAFTVAASAEVFVAGPSAAAFVEPGLAAVSAQPGSAAVSAELGSAAFAARSAVVSARPRSAVFAARSAASADLRSPVDSAERRSPRASFAAEPSAPSPFAVDPSGAGGSFRSRRVSDSAWAGTGVTPIAITTTTPASLDWIWLDQHLLLSGSKPAAIDTCDATLLKRATRVKRETRRRERDHDESGPNRGRHKT